MHLFAGANFSFLEATKMPGRLTAWFGSFIYIFFGVLINIRPLRRLWIWVLPDPGQMPKREAMVDGYWTAAVVGQSDESATSEQPVVVKAELRVSNADLCYCHSLLPAIATACLH